MKTKFYFLVLLIGFESICDFLQAQCVHDISTNPINPFNNQFDAIFPGKTNVFRNTYDWGGMDGVFDEVALNGSAGWGINGTIPDTILLNNLFDDANNVTGSNYDMLLQPLGWGANERDFHWEDGWELLYFNTGFYPNGDPIDEANANNIIPNVYQVDNGYVPYIMIYNRYTGKVRLFYKVFIELGQLDDIKCDFGFKQNQSNSLPISGLFRNNKPYDVPLSMPSDNFGITSSRKIPNSTQVWFYNEFSVAYDPCTCNYPSQLVLDLHGVKSTNMVLHGRGVEVAENLVNTDGSVAYPKDYLTNFSDGDGYVIYSMMDSLVSGYKTQLHDYNTDLEDYQAQQNNFGFQILTQLQEYINNGLAGLPGFAIGNLTGFSDFLAKFAGDIFGASGFTNDSLSGDSETINEAIKQGSKGLLGKGFSTLNMSIYGKKLNRPVKPSMPMANYSEMYYEGQISDTIPILGSPVYTPGTYQEAYNGLPLLTPQVYPVYNEVLGQFALLNKPQIDMTQYEESTHEMCGDNSCLLHGVWYKNFNKRVLKLRLTDTLRYKFNPALDFDTSKTQLYGSFIITLSALPADPTNDSLIIRQYLDVSEMYLSHYFNTGSERKLIVETPWLKVQKLLNRVFSMTLQNSNGCVCGVIPEPFPPNVHPVQPEQLAESIDKIEFKLMADMYFDQSNYHGDQNNTTQVFTYLLFDKDNPSESLHSVNFQNEDGSNWTRPYLPGTLTIDSPLNITPSSPQVIRQQDDTLFINAEYIEINNSVTVSAGYIAVFQGVYSVKIGPNGHLSPKIILKINDFGQSEITEASQNYIDNYCTGAISPSYHANQASKSLRKRMAMYIREDSSVKSHFPKKNSISIHPNPANSQIWITSSSKSISEIEIFDLSGRSLIHQKPDGADLTRVSVNVGALQSGVYIVKARCEDESSSQKLMIGR